jgi:hypothetical protein
MYIQVLTVCLIFLYNNFLTLVTLQNNLHINAIILILEAQITKIFSCSIGNKNNILYIHFILFLKKNCVLIYQGYLSNYLFSTLLSQVSFFNDLLLLSYFDLFENFLYKIFFRIQIKRSRKPGI